MSARSSEKHQVWTDVEDGRQIKRKISVFPLLCSRVGWLYIRDRLNRTLTSVEGDL